MVVNGQVVLPGFMIKVTSSLYGTNSIVCGVNMSSGVAVAECYKISRDLSAPVLLGKATAGGKDDSVSAVVFNDGTLRMYVSEADPPAGAGNTVKVRVYDFPSALPVTTQTAGSGTDIALRSIIKTLLTGMRDLMNKLLPLL